MTSRDEDYEGFAGYPRFAGIAMPGRNKLGLRDSEDEKVVLPLHTPGVHGPVRDWDPSPEELRRIARAKKRRTGDDGGRA
jgi:hypothetical protein